MNVTWRTKRALLGACVVTGGLALFVPPAEAAFKLQLSQAGFAVKTITDNAVGDVNADAGQVTSMSDYGTFDLSVISASSTRGTGGPGKLNSTSIVVKNKALVAKTLTIRLTDTGFGLPGAVGSPLTLLNTLAISGIGGASSMTLTSYADNSNTEFGLAVATPSVTIDTAPLELTSANTFLRTTPLYSLTHIGIVTLAPGKGINFSATTAAVPEPGTLALLAVGIAATSRTLRRRFGGRR